MASLTGLPEIMLAGSGLIHHLLQLNCSKGLLNDDWTLSQIPATKQNKLSAHAVMPPYHDRRPPTLENTIDQWGTCVSAYHEA